MNAIIYDSKINVRFSELDPYGHVNTKHYLDYVIQSRWDVIQNLFPNAMKEISSQKIGFFIAKAEINFLKPVVGCQSLNIKSHVSSIEEKFATVSFEVRNSKNILVSSGLLRICCVDLLTNKSQVFPDGVLKYFFYEKED